MDKRIIRKAKNREHPYVVMDKRVLQDERLSLKARGLMCFFLSLPDDWSVHFDELVRHFPDGRFSVRSAILELKRLGYVKVIPSRNERGIIRGWEYHIFEDPYVEPVKDKLTRYEGDAMYRQGVDSI
jgi:hypothetical protein